jgi:3-deoxy-D-manno-octulosonate 8-phosphate phosphatase (KDO 8-P phosphatase)
MMTLAERCRLISALILDVDGVLTDGGIIYAAGGREIKEFFVRDGWAIKTWQKLGLSLGILSGRDSVVTALRAKELGIALVEQGHSDKGPGFDRLLARMGVEALAVAYVGDDMPDVPVLRWCGLSVAPADACAAARGAAHYVTRSAGGRGAVREAIELILRSQGRWPREGE